MNKHLADITVVRSRSAGALVVHVRNKRVTEPQRST